MLKFAQPNGKNVILQVLTRNGKMTALYHIRFWRNKKIFFRVKICRAH